MAAFLTPTHHSPTSHLQSPPLQGEPLEIPERLVVSPAAGVFEPAFEAREGATICRGQVVGHVRCSDGLTQVTSPFAGRLRQFIAWQEERVQRYQPLMWMIGEAK